MLFSHKIRTFILLSALLHLPLMFIGCSSGTPEPQRLTPRSSSATISQTDQAAIRRLDQTQPQSESDLRPVALVYTRPINASAYASALAEAAGRQILEELILDAALERQAASNNLKINTQDIDAEERLLGQMLTQAAGLSESQSPQLIEQIRRARGYGPTRYPALLKRNATLRALARIESPEISRITPDDIDRAYAIRFGPRITARLILVRSLDKAQHALAALKPAQGHGKSFAEVAAAESIDPSSQRGGLLYEMSLADPNYPAAVMHALSTMKPGDISDPIAVSWPTVGSGAEQGYAIVKLEHKNENSGPNLASVRAGLEQEIAAVRERATMDRIARTLIDQASRFTTIFDESLDWSWQSTHTP